MRERGVLKENKENCINNTEPDTLEFTFEKDIACEERTAPSRWRAFCKNVSMIIAFCCALWLAKRVVLYLFAYALVELFYGARAQ